MKIIKITKESNIPLIGHIAFGIVDRGTSLLQIRPTTVCNLSCTFCSTDAGPNSKSHKPAYIIDADYLIEQTNKEIEKKEKVHINIDSVGEPSSYPQLVYLISQLKKNKKVYFISMQSNGTFLTKKYIKDLEKVGLNRIHLSIHTTNSQQAKELMGTSTYNLKKIIETAEQISKSKIELLLAPVWLPKINETEIEKLIQLAKKLNCKIGIQKYEKHKYGRKIKKVKEDTYFKFYKTLKEWEEKHQIKLVYNAKELEISPATNQEKPIQIGERINATILEEGWFKDQKITSHKGRTITINNCQAQPTDRKNIKITKNKHNIYLAETV